MQNILCHCVTQLIGSEHVYMCADGGQTTSVVNITDGSLSVTSSNAEGTTESTLYNITAVSWSPENFSKNAAIRDESNVTDAAAPTDVLLHYVEICPSRVDCDKLGADCIECEFNSTCRYGANVSAVCRVKPQIVCLVCTLCITSSALCLRHRIAFAYSTFCLQYVLWNAVLRPEQVKQIAQPVYLMAYILDSLRSKVMVPVENPRVVSYHQRCVGTVPAAAGPITSPICSL